MGRRSLITKCAPLVVAALGVAACAPGSAYDGLVGGSKVDATLAAPRQLSPVSISMVSTSRPHFRWDLADETNGAIVDLCRTRACDGDVKTFVAKGSDLVVPEDLEPGVWFWRLRSRADGKEGTQTSPTWELVVRGPAAHGSSEAPSGSLVDYDGDGNPDLFIVGDAPAQAEDPRADPNQIDAWVLPYKGQPDGTFAVDSDGIFLADEAATLAETQVALAGGSDFDGDGFADLAFGEYSSELLSGGASVFYGGPKGLDLTRETDLAFATSLPTLAVAGDMNGDGYADLFRGDETGLFVTLGGAKGPVALVPLLQVAPMPNDPAPAPLQFEFVAGGAFDIDADGLSDAAYGVSFVRQPAIPTRALSATRLTGRAASIANGSDDSSDSEADGEISDTLLLSPGSADMTLDRTKGISIGGGGGSLKLVKVASGDLDGDAVDDLAMTIEAAGVRKVCVYFGRQGGAGTQGPCVSGPAGDAAFGASLAVGDLEGDGVDELLASSSAGTGAVEVIRFDGRKATVSATLEGLEPSVTMIWPGRPGKARWAAPTAGYHGVRVYEGTTGVATIPAPTGSIEAPPITHGFGRVML